jgi:hypothetical protein
MGFVVLGRLVSSVVVVFVWVRKRFGFGGSENGGFLNTEMGWLKKRRGRGAKGEGN